MKRVPLKQKKELDKIMEEAKNRAVERIERLGYNSKKFKALVGSKNIRSAIEAAIVCTYHGL